MPEPDISQDWRYRGQSPAFLRLPPPEVHQRECKVSNSVLERLVRGKTGVRPRDLNDRPN